MRMARLRAMGLLASLVVACSAGQVTPTTTPTTPTPAPSRATEAPAPPSPAATATALPTPAPSPSATARPPRPTDATGRVELSARVRPLVSGGWRPGEPAVIVEERLESAFDALRVWAVPTVANRQGVLLVEVTGATGEWAMRRDGGAFVFAVASYDGAGHETRLALWDARSGAARWLTPLATASLPEGWAARSPVWSADGSEVFFHAVRYRQGAGGEDFGLWRIRADGSALAQVMRPVENALGLHLHGVTPDGRGLVWGRMGLEGASVEILDLATGAQRSLGCCLAYPASWRTARPRALIVRHTGQPGDWRLVLWDDLAPSSERVLVGPTTVIGADWDPREERVVAAVAPAGSVTFGDQQLVIMDATGRITGALTGTSGATRPLWEPEGIVYEQWTERTPGAKPPDTRPAEIRAIDPAGGTPAVLYRSPGTVRLIAVVR